MRRKPNYRNEPVGPETNQNHYTNQHTVIRYILKHKNKWKEEDEEEGVPGMQRITDQKRERKEGKVRYI